MATDVRVLAASHTDDASYRTLIAGFLASLTAAGATRASDTGQIDTATVTRPVAINSFSAAGAIFRFSDTLQATKPVFIKFWFGTGNSLANFRVLMQVGTSTDGAGNLTGTQLATQVDVGASSGTTLYASCGTDRMALHWLGGSTNSSSVMLIGRTKTDTGADASDGVMILRGGQSAVVTIQLLPFVGAVPAGVQASFQFGGIGGASGTTAGASDIAIGGIPTALGGLWRYMLGFLYGGSDLPALFTVSMTLLGALHTFLPLGSIGGIIGGGATGTTYVAIPWE